MIVVVASAAAIVTPVFIFGCVEIFQHSSSFSDKVSKILANKILMLNTIYWSHDAADTVAVITSKWMWINEKCKINVIN